MVPPSHDAVDIIGYIYPNVNDQRSRKAQKKRNKNSSRRKDESKDSNTNAFTCKNSADTSIHQLYYTTQEHIFQVRFQTILTMVTIVSHVREDRMTVRRRPEIREPAGKGVRQILLSAKKSVL